MRAFLDDAAVRDRALQALAAAHADKQIVRGVMHWADGKGSVAASLAQTHDVERFEAVLGLPAWLGYALDTLLGRLGLEEAMAEAKATLEAITPGVNVAPVGAKWVLEMLQGFNADLPPTSSLMTALNGIVGLHQQALRGELLTPGAWRSARKAAVQATNDEAPDPGEGAPTTAEQTRLRNVALTVEAAAWDPLLSPSAVGEVLRHWLSVASLSAPVEFGWSQEDDDRTGTLLAQMHETYIVNNPQEKRDVFQLLAAHHTAEEARLRAYMVFKNGHGRQCALKALQDLRQRLGDVR